MSTVEFGGRDKIQLLTLGELVRSILIIYLFNIFSGKEIKFQESIGSTYVLINRRKKYRSIVPYNEAIENN